MPLACRWSVGKLSEMPPEGKVGVSPGDILQLHLSEFCFSQNFEGVFNLLTWLSAHVQCAS